ncbi:MAG: PEP-utilizing enzyme [Armatimonadetes bacterium]|nr:PEP-utilizing enzyme [Armatimonadota bacterium]
MTITNISLTIPLVGAASSRKAGDKAADLSKLIAARFAVPRGFVISADAYRSHLWASGARVAATSPEDFEARRAVRSAIVSSDVPEDVWRAVTEAYQSLSLQLGTAEPEVIVHPSVLDEPASPGTRREARGLSELRDALKQVWASLWSEEATASREPAAAVIVQQSLKGDWSGTARTADPATGNPHCILISCNSSNGAREYRVDLRDMSVDPTSECIGDCALKRLAEESVLIENTLGAPVEVHWVLEGDRFWVLDVNRLAGLPRWFPMSRPDDAILTRLTLRPLSYFSREHLSKWQSNRDLINGYAYQVDKPDTEAEFGRSKDMTDALRALETWEKEVGPSLTARASAIIRADLSSLYYAPLIDILRSADEDWARAEEWMERADGFRARWVGRLERAVARLSDDPALHGRLLGGLPGPMFMRDARLQELGERFGIAERSGKLRDQAWWKSYRAEVEDFAREYGYSFASGFEMIDPASWTSWAEDTDTVFRMIGAISRRGGRPTLVTLHCAAEVEARKAEEAARSLLKAGERASFARLLRLARGWLVAMSESEHVMALACTAIRLILTQLGRRLKESGFIANIDDVFQLTLDELTALPNEPGPDARAIASTSIADRKHHIWLESRLDAPGRLPDGRATAPAGESDLRCPNAVASRPGTFTGRTRVARTVAEAGDVEEGDILIVKSLSYAWTPFLAVAGGIVSEEESDPSSAVSLFVREYGVPVVSGCEGVMRAVDDGRGVTVEARTQLFRKNQQKHLAQPIDGMLVRW